MDDFLYRDGRLHAESVPLTAIAERVGTPFYCYSTAGLERHYRAFADAFAGLPAVICYSVKANGNIAVVGTLARLGAGADVVSGGELKRALKAGVPASKVVFSGVGKSADELAMALDAGIMQINVESEPELELLGEMAASRGVEAPVALRINPDVDALTHDKITTGKAENKFGIGWARILDVYARGAAMDSVRMFGLTMHIGSQLTALAPFSDAFERLRELVLALRGNGHSVTHLDLGGGLGIVYDQEAVPAPAQYADVVRTRLGDLGCQLVFEPGRVIVGNAGLLLSRVLYVKEGATRCFVVVDAAMNDLMRPALYGAHHAILPVVQGGPETETREVDVVGPICETGDTFATRRALPEVKAGDLLAFGSAGAYGATMASTYNARPLVPEVLVKENSFEVVRERIEVDDLIARESFPDWLSSR